MGVPLFSRKYYVGSDEDALELSIFEPVERDGNWVCKYIISFYDQSYDMEIYGVDKLQAMTLALSVIPSELSAISDEVGKEVTLNGNPRNELL